MAGNEGSRILDLGAPFEQGFPEVSQLSGHSDRPSKDKDMHWRKLREKEVFRNQSSKDGTPDRSPAPLHGLAGADLGGQFLSAPGSSYVKGGGISEVYRHQGEEDQEPAQIKVHHKNKMGQEERNI